MRVALSLSICVLLALGVASATTSAAVDHAGTVATSSELGTAARAKARGALREGLSFVRKELESALPALEAGIAVLRAGDPAERANAILDFVLSNAWQVRLTLAVFPAVRPPLVEAIRTAITATTAVESRGPIGTNQTISEATLLVTPSVLSAIDGLVASLAPEPIAPQPTKEPARDEL